MESKAYLFSGELIDPKFSEGMWRVKISGRNICATTKQGLYDAVSFYHSVYFSSEEPVVIVLEEEKMIKILESNTSLAARQKALRQLEAMPNSPSANRAVSNIRAKQTSFGASYLTKTLGKSDFSQVTSVEISELVSDIIHRGQMIAELSDRVTL